LPFTGKVAVLVSVPLTAGDTTWALSPIKIQPYMGILLAFVFLWNMVDAVLLIPALSHVLLRSGGGGGKPSGAATAAAAPAAMIVSA
jgi:uncharacterized protein